MNSNWLTRAESTNYFETSRYAETMDYCLRLQQASPWIQYSSFGKSAQGRDLPLLVVSKEGHFTPEAARQSGKTIVFFFNGIHSGEIAGKEASLMLLRDIAILQQNPFLLNDIVLLVVPIFNVDGHERVSPYNRINQNGPKEMGWRGTAHNLNLNRDWIKADQPEMRAMLRLFDSWLPDITVDNHVSDGGDYQYDITYIADEHAGLARPVFHYFKNSLEPHLLQSMSAKGHVIAPYFTYVDSNDVSKGILFGTTYAPRFSTSFGTLRNRILIMTETHMLKSFETRIKAHYDFMEQVLAHVQTNGKELRRANQEADAESRKLGETWDTNNLYPIRFEMDQEQNEPFLFKGIRYTSAHSRASGKSKIVYHSDPWEVTVPLYRHLRVITSIPAPLGYIIPPQWHAVIERMEIHGIAMQKLTADYTGRFEMYRLYDPKWEAEPFEGRHMARFRTTKSMEERTFPSGSVVVRLNQSSNKLIMNLLEPEGPDSLVAWGFFDTIFEQKESAEDYILEKLAEEMLNQDPQLLAEFEEKLRTDSPFASDPAARLLFFYRRSPYWDPEMNLYPVARITTQTDLFDE